MTTRWPFLYDRTDSMLSLKRIFEAGAPILLVVHEEDGGYQFLDGEDCSDGDAAIVGLEAVLKHDPTIAEIACLPPGWFAARQTVNDAWQIGVNDSDDEDEDEELEDEDEN